MVVLKNVTRRFLKIFIFADFTAKQVIFRPFLGQKITFLGIKSAKMKIFKNPYLTLLRLPQGVYSPNFRSIGPFFIELMLFSWFFTKRNFVSPCRFYHIFWPYICLQRVKKIRPTNIFSYFNETHLVLSNCKILYILKHF